MTIATPEQSKELIRRSEEFKANSKHVEVPDILTNYKHINDYLTEHSNPDARPFKCPYLVVVPENLTFVAGNVYSMHAKGQLFCINEGGYTYCTIGKQALEVGEDGTAHIKCKNRGFDLVATINSVIDADPKPDNS